MSIHDADVTLRQIVEICDKAVELRSATDWEKFRRSPLAAFKNVSMSAF